jgi:ubiquinone/menaquinone biosynthesis C-methylase UbiE
MNYTEPFVPMPEDIIPKMLELASLKPGELVFDLGSGDGRILIAAARDFHAKAKGVEIKKHLVMECRRRVRELGLSGQVSVSHGSFKKVSLRKADVLALYLTSYVLNQLVPKFSKELKSGTRIVNFDYEIAGWTPAREIQVTPVGWKKPHPMYLYVT